MNVELVPRGFVADTYTAVSLVEADLELDPQTKRLSAGTDTLREFEAAGLLSPEGAPPGSRGDPLPKLQSSGEGRKSPRPLDVLEFAVGAVGTAHRCQHATLRAMTHEAAKRGRSGSGEEETLRRARVFPALLAGSPSAGECLFRSYALLRFLRAGGCDARWVFGVRTWPFGAHCGCRWATSSSMTTPIA